MSCGKPILSDFERRTLRFIADYRRLPELWDTNSKLYSNSVARKKALQKLGDKYNLDLKGVRNKIKSLRSYFSKEQHRVSKESDAESYESQWFAYKALNFILGATPGQSFEADDNTKYILVSLFSESSEVSSD